jgi:TonB-dependent SusC/RagA subfamily outer membrane receptor
MLKLKSCLLFIILFPFAAFAQVNEKAEEPGQANNSSVSKIGNKLQAYISRHIAEQVYLHFDKPYYAAGDTMYFKAYVTMGERHELSRISGVLHVELVNTKNKTDQSILLKLQNGVAWGDFAMPDSLPKGEYRVRAYTNWMRNQNETAFFAQTIPVGSALSNKMPESGARQPKQLSNKPNLQFFPEGGSLVAGLRSKISFKAIGSNGLGMDVRGKITDNTGRELTEFASEHLGMGYFYLEPEAGKTYKAGLSFADGSQNEIDLPKPEEQGITLTVDNDSLQKASVVIAANKAYYQQNKGKEYNLLIYSGGIAITVNLKLDSAVTKLSLVRRHLRTGVNTVTLLSSDNEPLCERLFFIQNYDQLNLSVNTDRDIYSPRGQINIKINAKNRADSVVAGHFSLSVIDESKVPVDENTESTILSNLLLTDDLKGNIEQPNYYFNAVTDEKLKHLDLVMLANGYRRFEWRQVLNNNQPLAYQPEKNLEIAGVVQSLGGRPIANAPVSLFSTIGGPVLSEKADEKGMFTFRNLEFLDTTRFFLQAVNTKGGNKTQLIYKATEAPVMQDLHNANADVNEQLTAYLKNKKEQLTEYSKYGNPKGIMLAEVKIKEIKAKNNYRSSVLGGPGHADQVVFMKDIPPGGELLVRLNGWLHGIRLFNGAVYSPTGKMLVVVDGITMDSTFDINNLGPNDVETVEVLKYANASIYGMGAGNGVIVFTTKQGESRDIKDIPSFGILPIIARGYYKARAFYSPQYNVMDASLRKRDLRSTIYWNPELITDNDGNASVNYYNADGAGNYRIVIEGIDEKGNLGRKVYRYTVK